VQRSERRDNADGRVDRSQWRRFVEGHNVESRNAEEEEEEEEAG